MSKKLLQYYQDKMQNGGKVLPMFKEGDPVIPKKYAPIPRASDIATRVSSPVMQMMQMTAEEARLRKAFNNGTIRTVKPQSKVAKALAIAANPVTAASYVVKGQRIPDNFEKGSVNNYDIAGSILNPFSAIDAASKAPESFRQGEYLDAFMNIADIVPGITTVPKSVRTALNQIDRLTPVGKKLNAIQREGMLSGMNDFEIAQRQMKKVGITSRQREAYIPGISELANKYVTPFGYAGSGGKNKLSQTLDNIRKGGHNMGSMNLGRQDSWRLYLGMPQTNKTFSIAKTSPALHSSYSPRVLKDMDIYSINDLDDFELAARKPYFADEPLDDYLEYFNNRISLQNDPQIMGGYNARMTKMGTEYNDIWDLEPAIAYHSLFPKIISEHPMLENIFYKKHKLGEFDISTPRGFKVPVNKFIGKPFMSHGINTNQTSYDFLEKLKNEISQVYDYAKPRRDIMIEGEKRVARMKEDLDFLNSYVPKYDEGGVIEDGPVPARYAPLPRANDMPRMRAIQQMMTAQQARNVRAFNNGTIRTAQPQNKIAKALAIAANPATAASYIVKGQRIPDNFNKAQTNKYDAATSVVNPFSYLQQFVDTRDDLAQGNYGSAAMNAMGILPMRFPNFGRITSNNLDGFLGKQLNNFSKDLQHLRGNNNEGVFLMRNNDDIVIKLEDANRTAHFTDTPEFLNTNMAEKMRSIPDNAPISKVLHQMDGVRINGTKVPLRASFMNRVKGVPGGEMKPSDFVNIPEEAYEGMYNNLKLLRNNDLAYDYFGNNYLYDPKNRQFGLFDIGLQPKQKGYWAGDVFGASSKDLYGVEKSAENIKTAMREKLSGDFRYTMEPEYEAFHNGQGNFDFNTLQAITAEGSRRVSDRIRNALKNLNAYAKGGSVAIVDPRGQWAHPGKRTMVPTSTGQITMQGVPYPVYGQDETGYGQMMYPGREYQFPGQMVDETPMMRNGGGLPKFQTQGQVGQPVDRNKILQTFYNMIHSGKRPYELPKEIQEKEGASKVCIMGVCYALEENGVLPKGKYFNNTSFERESEGLGLSKPQYDVKLLKPGDPFQWKQGMNMDGKPYPTHAQMFKGYINDGKDMEFYDYYDYYNRGFDMNGNPIAGNGQTGVKTYPTTHVMAALDNYRTKRKDETAAQFFSLDGQKAHAEFGYPFNTGNPEVIKKYFANTKATDRVYTPKTSGVDPLLPAYYLSDAYIRDGNKQELAKYFNDSALDKQIREQLNISDQDLQSLKPLIYGMYEQESNFGLPKKNKANLKYQLETRFPELAKMIKNVSNHNLPFEDTELSVGPGQIKFSSISKQTKKAFGLKDEDLQTMKGSYLALVDLLHKAASHTDYYVNSGYHPGLEDKNRYERALYWLNSPGRVRTRDNNLSLRDELRMDPGSYPAKVVEHAKNLQTEIDNNDSNMLPEVFVKGRAKKKDGGSLPIYQTRGQVSNTYKPTAAYNKKYPPIYLNDPNDPRIGYYAEAGNQWLYRPAAKKSTPATIYVDNPNDPRLQRYKDSLQLSSRKQMNPNPVISPAEFEKIHYKGAADVYKERGNKPIGFRDFSDTPYRASEPVFAKPKQRVEYRKPQPVGQQPTPVSVATPIQPQVRISVPQQMADPVFEDAAVLPYRVDYSGLSKYFPSNVEGEAFMRQLNSDFMNNRIANPGNVSGYYNTQKKQFANGGFLNRTITCSNCGHSWEAVDGGTDPLTCHKCGGMVKMRGGGESKGPGKGGKQEVTYTHQPARDVYDENGNLVGKGEQYMLKRTVTPYTSRRDIRRFTQSPTDPRQVNFISNYAGSGVIGDPINLKNNPQSQYPTAVPFEGEKHWNIDRFVLEPAFQFSSDTMPRVTDDRQAEKNVLADMYKYYMLQGQDRNDAFRSAKKFVRKEIRPRVKSEYLKAVDDRIGYVHPRSITTFADSSNIDNPFISLNNVNRGMSSEKDRVNPNYAEYYKNPYTEKDIERISRAYLKDFKRMSGRDSRQMINQWVKDAAEYEKKYAYQMAHPPEYKEVTCPPGYEFDMERQDCIPVQKQQFKNGGQHGGLDRWFAEKWVDVKSGKPCGRQDGEDRAYPACRPSRRVSSDTPKTSSEMSPAEKARFKREKNSSQRISYNHKRNK